MLVFCFPFSFSVSFSFCFLFLFYFSHSKSIFNFLLSRSITFSISLTIYISSKNIFFYNSLNHKHFFSDFDKMTQIEVLYLDWMPRWYTNELNKSSIFFFTSTLLLPWCILTILRWSMIMIVIGIMLLVNMAQIYIVGYIFLFGSLFKTYWYKIMFPSTNN